MQRVQTKRVTSREFEPDDVKAWLVQLGTTKPFVRHEGQCWLLERHNPKGRPGSIVHVFGLRRVDDRSCES